MHELFLTRRALLLLIPPLLNALGRTVFECPYLGMEAAGHPEKDLRVNGPIQIWAHHEIDRRGLDKSH